MVRRVNTGAHYGVRDWLAQRFSAVFMVLYSIFLLSYVVLHQPLNYAQWHGLFQQQAMRIFTLLFALSLFIHAWVGVRDVLMDYVRSTWLRLSLQVATIAALLVYSMWVVSLLWGAA